MGFKDFLRQHGLFLVGAAVYLVCVTLRYCFFYLLTHTWPKHYVSCHGFAAACLFCAYVQLLFSHLLGGVPQHLWFHYGGSSTCWWDSSRLWPAWPDDVLEGRELVVLSRGGARASGLCSMLSSSLCSDSTVICIHGIFCSRRVQHTVAGHSSARCCWAVLRHMQLVCLPAST